MKSKQTNPVRGKGGAGRKDKMKGKQKKVYDKVAAGRSAMVWRKPRGTVKAYKVVPVDDGKANAGGQVEVKTVCSSTRIGRGDEDLIAARAKGGWKAVRARAANSKAGPVKQVSSWTRLLIDCCPPVAPRRPHLGVAVFVRDGASGPPDDRRYLLVCRRKAGVAGAWSLPGGRVEYGEDMRAAAVNRVFGETGLRVHGLRLMADPFASQIYPNGEHHIIVFFRAIGPALDRPKVGRWFFRNKFPTPLLQPLPSYIKQAEMTCQLI